ncbi:MAG: NADH-quinone oxidoreductase subunit [Solirubrobacteraceae bacterium]|nr:NADH-quinone oxidoreductase subunit [Solirubrobacteraceae bacterium]MEA2355119.1 NADH-quinone oxidoreductase subunit [Solirubrobacteraceae bacterium]
MSTILFFLAAIGAIAGAIGVIAIENPFYTVLALVSHLISLALLFLLLSAEFIAAAQVIVYAGAVMVLYTFVVSYVGGQDAQPRIGEPLGRPPGRAMTLAAWGCGGALMLELCVAVLGSALKGLDTRGAALPTGFGQPGQIGDLLLTNFLAPFEIASYLLLVAAVGAVVLARRRGGIGDDDGIPTIAAIEIFRPPPPGTGTMAEAAGRIHATPAREETSA